jgi:two-component system response regulator (stage 0 sporulation protein F)
VEKKDSMVNKKKILHVDDEQGILLLYKVELEDKGFQIESANSGEEALEKFKANPPDLVILDINMPTMNGIEVLRQMKKMNADLPVILNSAYPEYKEDFASWASEAYIVKSANMDELISTVHKYLD